MRTMAALLALTLATGAPADVLTYQGADMTGVSTSYNLATAQYINSPFDASYGGILDISGTLAAHDLRLVSAAFNFGANLIYLGPAPIFGFGGPEFCSDLGGCIDLTYSGNQLTGATVVGLTTGAEGRTHDTLNIGQSGDSLLEKYANLGGCENNGGLCGFTISNTTPGTWTVTSTTVPEIDPASAGAGLTLLFGSLAVLRSRNRRT